jgi:hypothetical protein
MLEAGFTSFIRQLQASAELGVKITIALPPPYSTYDLPRELARRRFLGIDRTELEHMPRAPQEAARAPVKILLNRLAGEPGVRLLDPFELLCTREQCDTVDGAGFPLFRDSNHLRSSFLAESHFLDASLTW